MAAGSPTRNRPRLSRERIVSSARQRVEDTGYESLSLRSLATDLGVTAPAIYDHFESKAHVLQAVAELGYGEMDLMFQVDGIRAIDRCRQRAYAYVQFAQQRPELFRVMFLYRPAAVTAEADNELSAATATFDAGLVDICEAVADGDLVGRDPIQLNLTLWAAVHGVASIALMSPALADQVVEDVIEAVFVGLRG